jgi:hypothetical protein
MRTIGFALLLVTCIGLAGSATTVNADLLSAKGMVIAILAGDLFIGEAEGHLSGAGTLVIHSQQDPTLTCLGEFTSTAELGGSGELHCSDGTTATFHFQRLTIFCGYGEGSFSRGPMSFAYGLTVEEANPYLRLPQGKKLTHNGTEPNLVSN